MPESPWSLIGQEATVGRLRESLESGRLPHGMLLAGPEGVGKATAALQVAAGLLCAGGPTADACGRCPPCRHFESGTAPDFIRLTAEPGEEIRIDAVREQTRQLYLTPQESGARVVLLDPAEAMNAYAANALLKVLEEPPGTAFFLLVSHRPGRLPPTIRSRCQTFSFSRVEPDTLAAWLRERGGPGREKADLAARLAGGSPGRAERLCERDLLAEREAVVAGLETAGSEGGEPLLEVAKAWAGAEPDSWLPYLQAWLRDMARVTVTGPRIGPRTLINADVPHRVLALTQSLTPGRMEELLSASEALADAVTGSENLRLAADSFLLKWRWNVPAH